MVSAAGRQQAGSCLHQSSGQIAIASQLASPWLVELCRIGTGAGTASGLLLHLGLRRLGWWSHAEWGQELGWGQDAEPTLWRCHQHPACSRVCTVWGSAPGGDHPLWPGWTWPACLRGVWIHACHAGWSQGKEELWPPFLGHLRGTAWDTAHGLALKVLTGSCSGMRTEKPRGMLRPEWWKQDGNWGCMMRRGSIGRRNVISWDNPAAEQGGSSFTAAEPSPHPGSPHTGPGFVPR